ncbi:MAG: SHD1 domain-containing protein, partial [Planctomycetota bacterium]
MQHLRLLIQKWNSPWAIAFLCVTLLLQSPTLARRWTDTNGQSVSATFVRVNGNTVVLKQGTKILQIPFAKFCEEDQEYINSKRSSSQVHVWEINGRKVRGALKEYSEGQVVLTIKSRDRSFELEMLSSDDVKYLRDTLERTGKLESLASTDPLLGGADIRTWHDRKGRDVRAAFVGLDGDKVILRVKGKEKRLAISKLSDEDQRFLESHREPPPEQIASAPRRGFDTRVPSGGQFFGSSGARRSHADFIAESQARADQAMRESERLMRESQRRHEQNRIPSPVIPSPTYANRSATPGSSDSGSSFSNNIHANQNTFSTPSSASPPSNRYTYQTEEYSECSNCK